MFLFAYYINSIAIVRLIQIYSEVLVVAGAYKWKRLSDIDISDSFFDSLKEDYPEFEKWYIDKAKKQKQAFAYIDEHGLGAFVMLKSGENEEIALETRILPNCSRLKISTLKLSERVEGNRLGEGAIGIALWKWLESDDEEIYVTVFDKHKKLIDMLKKFGFILAGRNAKGEGVYLRSKQHIDFATPYSSFPFINKEQEFIAMLPIEPEWHDKIFPYSELKNTLQDTEEFAAANGMTKTYICFPYTPPVYISNMPIMIYRKSNEYKGYKSVVTSYGTVVRFEKIKQNNQKIKSYEEYINIVGNKSVFTDEEIKSFYDKRSNLYVLELVYNHAFGEGHNVNYNTLKYSGIWKDCHPFQAKYSMNDFRKILSYAKQDENKLIK